MGRLVQVKLTVNDKTYKLKISPQKTLLSVLRENLRFTSVKNGCDMGECGMCTCLVDNKPVYSCIMLATVCQDKKIMTLEGLPKSVFDVIYEGFAKFVGLQCGFCTPAFEMLTASILLRFNKKPTNDIIKKYIDSALCRCTGYIKIWQAMIYSINKYYSIGE